MIARLLAIGIVLAGALAAPASAAPSRATMVVENFRFKPNRVEVARGGTVVFDVRESGHIVAAKDGSFDLRGDDGGTLPAGTIREVQMPDADVYVDYVCSVHSSMTGTIKVGDPPLPDTVIEVPEDQPDLRAALARAERGMTIDLAPDTEHELAGAVHLDGVRIRGRTGNASDVVVSAASGTSLTGSHSIIEDLTISGDNVSVVGANAVAWTNVTIEPRTRHGLVFDGTTGITLRDVRISGAIGKALVVKSCGGCGFLAEGLDLRGNEVGLWLEDAHGVIVRSSTFTGGRVGIAAAGLGGALIERNTFEDMSAYAIAVGARPAIDVVVRDNTAGAPIGWDGLGSRTCFAGNDAEPSPPTLFATAGCEADPPFSVPWPLVTLEVR